MQVMLQKHYFIDIVDMYQYITPFVYPVAMIAQTSSIYITMVITMERYIVVCLPLESRRICTYSRSKRYIILVLVLSTLYNIPRFFEYELKDVNIDMDGDLVTVTYLQSTKFRLDPIYIQIYVNWLYMIFMYGIPFSFLSVANIKIGLAISEARKARRRMCIETQKMPNEESLSIMLMFIVLIFIACNSLAMVSNILESFQFSALAFTQVSNLLVVLNSSITVIVYCIFCKKFRKNLLYLLRLRSRQRNSANGHLKSISNSSEPTPRTNGSFRYNNRSGASFRTSYVSSNQLRRQATGKHLFIRSPEWRNKIEVEPDMPALV